MLSLVAFACLSVTAPPNTPHTSAAEPKDAVPEFGKVGVAFLQKHCVQCHGPKLQRASVRFDKYDTDEALLKNRKLWQHALELVNAGEMPPPKTMPRPADADIEIFSKSVAAVFARADKNAKPDPGRVTIRRLNRVEYNNTIRDLIGVDFQPAEDFPSDDVGNGFDNIGDVLSLSPILMERYLAAAENIVSRAVLSGDPPKPPVRHMSSRYLEPALPESAQNSKFRLLTATKRPLNTPYNITQGGDFKFRVRAYGQQLGDEPVRIALVMDGKEIKTIEVKIDSEKKAENFEIDVPLTAGQHRGAVTLLNEGKDGDKQRGLFVESFVLEGPMDTRPESHKRIMLSSPDKPKREQAREILERFASKAYRRPATTDEVERLLKLVDQAQARSERWEAGVQLALQAALCSPKFLFRVELDDRPDTAEAHPLDEYQLASRLSYFLWSTMPDDELFDLAAKKELSKNLETQVRRMLKDPKSKALVDNFAMQWLQLRTLKTFAPDPKLFPNFDEPLRAAMLKETELFFDAVMREDRSILDLLDADFTFLNERLARHYGIADTAGNWIGQKATHTGGRAIRGPQFVRVTLSDRVRGGLLTQASVLAVTSNPTRTSPVKRGRWVLEQLLGTPPPPPPPNVPELPTDAKAVLTGSLRQRMEQHRANPSCANCHAKMDPIGFGLENFNAVGAFRTKDGDFDIDPSGTLPNGKSFKGPVELKEILRGKKDQFSRCLTEKMLIYALGRGLEYYDTRTVEGIQTALVNRRIQVFDARDWHRDERAVSVTARQGRRALKIRRLANRLRKVPGAGLNAANAYAAIRFAKRIVYFHAHRFYLMIDDSEPLHALTGSTRCTSPPFVQVAVRAFKSAPPCAASRCAVRSRRAARSSPSLHRNRPRRRLPLPHRRP